MLRRVLVTLLQRSFVFLLLICLGCSAQSAPSDTTKAIERQVRPYYKLPPEVEVVVGPLKPSDFPNYDALKLTFNRGTRKDEYDFLLSKDHKTLIRMTKMDLSKDPNAEIMKKMDLNGRPTKGPKNAKVVVVNYDDFQCPFCSRMHQTLFPEIFKEYGDRVLFIYKDYPLSEIHPWAIHAAVDASCLATQNADAYWDFADYIHANKQVVDNERTPPARLDAVDKMALLQGQRHNVDLPKLQACLKAQNEDAVRASMKEADSLGVDATPTLFINGQKIDGAVPIDQVRTALDTALRDAGQPVPPHNPSSPTPASK